MQKDGITDFSPLLADLPPLPAVVVPGPAGIHGFLLTSLYIYIYISNSHYSIYFYLYISLFLPIPRRFTTTTRRCSRSGGYTRLLANFPIIISNSHYSVYHSYPSLSLSPYYPPICLDYPPLMLPIRRLSTVSGWLPYIYIKFTLVHLFLSIFLSLFLPMPLFCLVQRLSTASCWLPYSSSRGSFFLCISFYLSSIRLFLSFPHSFSLLFSFSLFLFFRSHNRCYSFFSVSYLALHAIFNVSMCIFTWQGPRRLFERSSYQSPAWSSFSRLNRFLVMNQLYIKCLFLVQIYQLSNHLNCSFIDIYRYFLFYFFPIYFCNQQKAIACFGRLIIHFIMY